MAKEKNISLAKPLKVVLWGLWFPLFMVLVAFIRFGNFPEGVGFVELFVDLVLFHVVGCISALACLSSMERHAGRPIRIFVTYLVVTPFSVFGSLVGGLLGFVGVIVFGSIFYLIPWLLWRLVPKPRQEAVADG